MTEPSQPTTTVHAGRVKELRTLLAADSLDGFLVPHADEHQSEYLPPSAERLAWLTGFTGSAGTAIIMKDRAALFVDGRYTLQAAGQTDTDIFEHVDVGTISPSDWIAGQITAGQRIGYDPWLTTIAQAERMAAKCLGAGAELVAVPNNPIDRLWKDRPDPPAGAVTLHPIEFAGREAADKIAALQQHLGANKADAAILTQPDSIAWTFNIRGTDIAHNPVALAFAILHAAASPDLFIDGRKLSNSVRAYLAGHARLRDIGELPQSLADLGSSAVLVDADVTADAIATAVTEAGGRILKGRDPTALPKAKKNETELTGARAAQVRDGAAMVRFLAWLDRVGAGGQVDEIAAAERLAAFRVETARQDRSELVDVSFDTISGAGPNGAIVHYRVTPETSLKLTPGSLYLTDSGGQYRDGTTDITRTVPIGTPSDEIRDRFTRVLKGHIALATAIFPTGTSGAQIDTLARQSLWQAGLDYDHGTGHGIGSFLSVHEGPARISKLGSVALETGMILSNEPGYYKAGSYGIRIENLIVVRQSRPIPDGERDMLEFETISLCPIDRRLVDVSLLNADEIGWLDAYHAGLSARLDHLLDDAERAWLAEATRPLDS